MIPAAWLLWGDFFSVKTVVKWNIWKICSMQNGSSHTFILTFRFDLRERRFWNSHSQMACAGFIFLYASLCFWFGVDFVACVCRLVNPPLPPDHMFNFLWLDFFVLFSRSCCLKNKKKKKKGKKQPHPNPKTTTKHSKPAKQKKPLNPLTLESPPENIASYDESVCGIEWELVLFFFFYFDNTVENFSGSTTFSHLYTFSHE